MIRTSGILFAAAIAVALAANAVAQAPRPPAAEDPDAPPPARPARPAPAGGPSLAGSWAGPVTQVEGKTQYSVVVNFTPRSADIEFPELDCSGKLVRSGSSKSYAFFVALITKGRVDQGGRCADGTVTVSRTADNLAFGWFSNFNNQMIVAYAVLTLRPAAERPAAPPPKAKAKAKAKPKGLPPDAEDPQ